MGHVRYKEALRGNRVETEYRSKSLKKKKTPWFEKRYLCFLLLKYKQISQTIGKFAKWTRSHRT